MSQIETEIDTEIDTQIPFNTQIVAVSNFIVDKIKILDKNFYNKIEINIIMNKLFEIFCSKLIYLDEKNYLNVNNKKINDLSIIIINLLNYKMLSNELDNKKNFELTNTMNLEISSRINNFKSLMENDDVKYKIKFDLLIIFQALSIIIRNNLEKLGETLIVSLSNKKTLLDTLDEFKSLSEIYNKLLNYRILL